MSTKQRLFVMDAFKWAPEGLFTWFLERDQRPVMVFLRENRKYMHEIARKLIEEKRRELIDGTSRKDLLSLLGSSYVLFMKRCTRYNDQFFSKGEPGPATRLAVE
jgi:hypothetical protein